MSSEGQLPLYIYLLFSYSQGVTYSEEMIFEEVS